MHKTNIEKLQYYFRHFSLRLSERYNILITFKDYVDMCSLPHLKDEMHIKRPDGKTSICGFINIKGKEVRVYRRTKKPLALLTALPNKKKNKTPSNK